MTGWITWLLNNIFKRDLKVGAVADRIGAGANSIFNKYTGAGLTGADVEANAFTAEQAELANERNVYNYQNRFQWQTEDMRKAGLNPALMYGGASSPSAVAGAPAAASASPQSQGLGDLIGGIMDIALLKSQIANIDADTRQKNASAENIETLTPEQVREIEQKIRESNQNITESDARVSVALAQSVLVAKETEWYDKISESQISLNKSYEDLNQAYKSESKERVSEIEQRIENLKREIVESIARCAVYAANAGYLSQSTLTAMEQEKLLRAERGNVGVEYLINDKIYQNFDVDKWFNRFQIGASGLRDIGIGASSFSSFGGLFGKARKIGYK